VSSKLSIEIIYKQEAALSSVLLKQEVNANRSA